MLSFRFCTVNLYFRYTGREHVLSFMPATYKYNNQQILFFDENLHREQKIFVDEYGGASVNNYLYNVV